jgi:hypothetical protein
MVDKWPDRLNDLSIRTEVGRKSTTMDKSGAGVGFLRERSVSPANL